MGMNGEQKDSQSEFADYKKRGDVYLSTNPIESAVEYSMALEIDQHNAELWNKMATALESIGTDESIKFALECVKKAQEIEYSDKGSKLESNLSQLIDPKFAKRAQPLTYMQYEELQSYIFELASKNGSKNTRVSIKEDPIEIKESVSIVAKILFKIVILVIIYNLIDPLVALFNFDLNDLLGLELENLNLLKAFCSLIIWVVILKIFRKPKNHNTYQEDPLPAWY